MAPACLALRAISTRQGCAGWPATDAELIRRVLSRLSERRGRCTATRFRDQSNVITGDDEGVRARRVRVASGWSVDRAGDHAERIVELGTERGGANDDGNTNQGGNQAVRRPCPANPTISATTCRALACRRRSSKSSPFGGPKNAENSARTKLSIPGSKLSCRCRGRCYGRCWR